MIESANEMLEYDKLHLIPFTAICKVTYILRSSLDSLSVIGFINNTVVTILEHQLIYLCYLILS